MDNDSEDDDDSYSSEQEASDDAVHAQVGARTCQNLGPDTSPVCAIQYAAYIGLTA